jgi:hypothetical protein
MRCRGIEPRRATTAPRLGVCRSRSRRSPMAGWSSRSRARSSIGPLRHATSRLPMVVATRRSRRHFRAVRVSTLTHHRRPALHRAGRPPSRRLPRSPSRGTSADAIERVPLGRCHRIVSGGPSVARSLFGCHPSRDALVGVAGFRGLRSARLLSLSDVGSAKRDPRAFRRALAIAPLRGFSITIRFSMNTHSVSRPPAEINTPDTRKP